MASNNKLITTPLARIDLTKLDYNSIINEIKSIIKSNPKYSPNFTSYFESDVAVMLIELFSQIAQLNNLRIDFVSNELSWVNAEQDDTILRFLPLIDYRLKSVLGSQTPIVATVVGEPGGVSTVPIVIPARTRLNAINTSGAQSVAEFLYSSTDYTSAIVLPAGLSGYDLIAYAGITDRIDLTIPVSSNYTFKINKTNVIDDSIQVFLNQNGTYVLLTRVESFIAPLESNPTYTVRFNFQGEATIIFGNKFFGGSFDGIVESDPSTHKEIVVYYRYISDNKGSETNYSPLAISQNIEFFAPVLGRNITLNIFNPEFGTNGTDILSIEDVRRTAPLTIRTADKAVTNEDSETFLKQNIITKDAKVFTPIDEPQFNIPIFYAHAFVAANRSNSAFISTKSTPASYELPDPIQNETNASYTARFLASLNEYYNLRGIETSATLTSSLKLNQYVIIENFNDRLRIITDTSDPLNYHDIKLTPGALTPQDIIDQINFGMGYGLASVNTDNSIVFKSLVLGSLSFIQLLPNFEDLADNAVLEETYSTLGFNVNDLATGADNTLEALELYNILNAKRIACVDYQFKNITMVPFNIIGRIYYNQTANPSNVLRDVNSVVNNNYSYQSMNIGQQVRKSTILKTLMSVSGVDYVELTNFDQDILPGKNELYFVVDPEIVGAIPDAYQTLKTNLSNSFELIRNETT